MCGKELTTPFCFGCYSVKYSFLASPRMWVTYNLQRPKTVTGKGGAYLRQIWRDLTGLMLLTGVIVTFPFCHPDHLLCWKDPCKLNDQLPGLTLDLAVVAFCLVSGSYGRIKIISDILQRLLIKLPYYDDRIWFHVLVCSYVVLNGTQRSLITSKFKASQ